MQATKKMVYVTNDGKLFIDRVEAAEHELEDSLSAVMNVLGWCKGGEWSKDMILRSMLENKDRFQEIFAQFDKNLTQGMVESGH